MSTNDERWNESNAALVEVVRDEIRASGPIRFDRFMDLVLYHDPHGYYRSPQARPGRRGDFLTAPEAHPIFGAALAAQIVDFDQMLGHPAQFTIVEYGAGSGLLIRPLLAELRQQYADLYDRIAYRPVEINPIRLDELKQHLADGGHEDKLVSLEHAARVTGCVIANEFLDAFPARRITRSNSVLAEAFVDWQDGWFIETTQPTQDADVARYLERHSFSLEEDEWIEFQPGIAGWIQEIEQILQRGFALIIDYGYPAAELFAEHRRGGTLRAYYHHGTSTEFFRGIGEQDLTVHVNMSEVTWQAEQHALSTLGITTQADLLAALGIGERLMNLQQQESLTADDYLAVRAAVMRMIDPGAMGRFRALFFGRGPGADQPPVGLKTLAG